ncbi:hypothetical protein [Solimonas terrae]|uniref:Uncharacterized protein n=1 Tax=Solimonas terrae TaxID=1396819 RepID=A0A6M2BR15_9GAMM|nr:hypothetical protein [Solimonas terrae]NGY04651.1 hypothetical protein [Solimonas terrae]
MDIDINHTAAAADAVPAVRPLPTKLTKSQTRAAVLADALAIKRKWKTLIALAGATWNKLHTEELVRVDGNFHRLAGLVQLRYAVSREEADRQTKAFFALHDLAL